MRTAAQSALLLGLVCGTAGSALAAPTPVTAMVVDDLRHIAEPLQFHLPDPDSFWRSPGTIRYDALEAPAPADAVKKGAEPQEVPEPPALEDFGPLDAAEGVRS